MLVLGIESSCDETAAAVVDGERRILSDVVASQVDVHRRYGGVVPELASRRHLAMILPVVTEALEFAGVTPGDLDGVVVTRGPGLIGSLLVGLQVAKSLAYVHGLPFVGVNHLEGHLLAILLRLPPGVPGDGEGGFPRFPYVGLVASGGHTSLYLVEAPGHYRGLGHTRDDAAGEAFDKVAKMLGLGYPGGPVVDRLAMGGNPTRYRFPRAMPGRGNLDFSFSGLKTAVRRVLEEEGTPAGEAGVADLCASLQEAIADVLVTKALEACKFCRCPRLVLAGGVAANSRVRSLALERGGEEGVEVFLPPRRLCTDNGAMIAVAGLHRLVAGEGDDRQAWLGLNAQANLLL